MGRQFFVDVLAFKVRDGEIPVYRPLGDEEWYYLDADGSTWKTADRGTHLPEIEVAGWTPGSVSRAVMRAVVAIANLQEHGGTVVVFARSFHKMPGDQDIWSFVGSMVMSSKTGSAVQEAVKLFDRTLLSMEGVPARLEIDDFTLQHLDYMDTVDEVHDL